MLCSIIFGWLFPEGCFCLTSREGLVFGEFSIKSLRYVNAFDMLCFRYRDRDRDRGRDRDRDRDNRGRDRRRRRHGDDEDDSRSRRGGGGGGAQIAPPVSLTASSNTEQDNGVYYITYCCFKSLSCYWVLFLFLFRE